MVIFEKVKKQILPNCFSKLFNNVTRIQTYVFHMGRRVCMYVYVCIEASGK